jgi:hypothetical protein
MICLGRQTLLICNQMVSSGQSSGNGSTALRMTGRLWTS